MRDADRFKDKIEVSLDSRQVFFLFFGGAVVACLVFVLGVMVGKRLEGRERVAHKAATSAQVDPLAALDELAADEQAVEKTDDLAFASALAGDRRAPELRPAKAQQAVAPATAAAAPAGDKAAGDKAAGDKAATDKAATDKAATDKERPKKDGEKVAVADTDKKDRDKKDGKKGKFTLQISSFQERTEADALLARLSGSGYKPYVVMSNVPDKGVFFRVRIGEFPSKSEAQDAKAEFEKKQHLLAYVTKI